MFKTTLKYSPYFYIAVKVSSHQRHEVFLDILCLKL